MKINSIAVTLLATFPATSLGECLTGSFFLEFDGVCTPEAIIEAYNYQVFNAAGATSSSCTLSADEDLLAKVQGANLDNIQDLCNHVYSTQDKVPFRDAAKRHRDDDDDDMHFEKMFFNGFTDWQEEVETTYERDDRSRTSILKEDAEQIRVFHDSQAQGRRMAWPGDGIGKGSGLPNFQSGVKDASGLATCTSNAAMCCWPKDRQANDNNGNCATDTYAENCVDKDPADNTNLCYVDLEKGNNSTNFDSKDILVYPGDGDAGEGAIHCHGLAWSNNVNDHTARYKANNLFFVSMYDHMYQRGYVKNIPGAPMCGCVEQMPTVTRSDCTQVDLKESIEITYNADAKLFKAKLAYINVDFNACVGINGRRNDLWTHVAKLYYQGDITSQQYGEVGRTLTNSNCGEATNFALNKKSLTPGYDHDVSTWSNVAGRDSMKLHDHYGHRAFTKSLTPNTDVNNTHYGIIFRACQSCFRTHKKIFYRRRTPLPDGFNLPHNILHQGSNGNGQNVWDVDFSLHSTHEDAQADVNPWSCPNDFFRVSETFYGECSPDGSRVSGQRSRFQQWFDRKDVAYFANKAESDGLQIVKSTAIKGRYNWASGVTLKDTALKDSDTGDIYMTGSGIDIYYYNDDFNYHSQPAEGDHTVIVHVGSISSPDNRYNSKSGIMFRSSMDNNSPHYTVYLSGSYGVCSLGRTGVGGWTNQWSCVQSGATEAWLKIEKRMDRYTSFVGADDSEGGPVIWTQLDSREIPAIGDSYHIGLAVCSISTYAQEVIFKGYEIDQYYFPSAAPSTSSAPSIFVPSQDIGNVGAKGSAAQHANGSWTVNGSGTGMWSRSDSFHFVDFAKSGNVKVEILINDFAYIYSWQKGGIMFRESMETNSKHFSLYLTGSNGISNQWRSSTGGYSYDWHNSSLKTKPVWLQVVKIGNQLTTAYKYPGATEWTTLRSGSMDFAGDSFYVGMAVGSQQNYKLAKLEVGEFNIIDMPDARKLRSSS